MAALITGPAWGDDLSAPKFLATPAGPDEVVLHVKAVIDGSNVLTLKTNSALWEQSMGSPTRSLSLNDLKWDWQHHRHLTLPDDQTLLPPEADFQSIRVELIKGKGIVACEPSEGKVVVYIDEMSQHSAPYDFILHFSTAPPSGIPHANSPSVHLKIAAVIDGSDKLTLTHSGAIWQHLSWDPASHVSLNNIPWPLEESSELDNEGATQFLPPDVDFSTAKVIDRSGRDLVTARGSDDSLIVYFGDSPSGSDQYEINISFGDSP